jgi:uncharacterized membrane-anchored protein
VVATFALGTAAGDLTSISLNLGYLGSAVLYAVVIAIPVTGYRFLGWNPIFSFWFAYVITRPLGASVADWLGKPTSVGGLGLGDGPVALVLALAIAGLVCYLAITRADVQRQPVSDARGNSLSDADTTVLPVVPGSPVTQPIARGVPPRQVPHGQRRSR